MQNARDPAEKRQRVEALAPWLAGLCVSATLLGRSRHAGWPLFLGGAVLAIAAGFVIRWAGQRWLAPAWRELEPSRRPRAVMGALATGFFLSLVLPLHAWPGPLVSVIPRDFAALVTLSLAAALLWCVSTRSDWSSRPPGRFAWLLHGAPLAASLVFQWLVWWPGGMTSDSYDQWAQLLNGHWNDWHPVSHTALLWLATRVAFTPAAVVLPQIVAICALVGWLIATLRRLGAPAGVAWLVSVGIAVLPGSVTVLMLWKDVAFSIFVLAFSALLLHVVSLRGEPLRRPAVLAGLVLVVAMSALIRSNGPLGSFGALAVLVVAYPAHRARVVAALVVSLLVWGGVRTVLLSALHLTTPPKLVWWQVHHLAAHAAAGTELTAEEQRLFERLSPGTGGRLSYDPYHIDTTVFSPGVSYDELHAPTVTNSVWRHTLLRAPWVNVEHQLLASQFTWQVWHPPEMNFSCLGPAYDEDGRLTLLVGADVLKQFVSPESLAEGAPRPASKLPSLTAPLDSWLASSRNSHNSWLCWGGGLALYLLLFGCAVAARRRRDWHWLLPMAPCLLNTLGLVAFSVSSEFRFVAPTFFTGMVMGPLLLFVSRSDAGVTKS